MTASAVLLTALHVALGLGLFLGGLFTMRYGLRQLTSHHAERAIARFVKSPVRGLMTGIAATLLTQSSAAVTILSMGLVAAGVLRFEETIGIILGTNIGSTMTVGLLSLDIDRFGPWIIGLGSATLVWNFVRPMRRARINLFAASIAIIGFGTLFVGFGVMGHAMQPVAQTDSLQAHLLRAQVHPWYGVLAGTVVTAIIGSSSATTALTLSLARQGALTLTPAIAIVLGNNIGTTVTAVLASIGGTRAVGRVAATHVLLNVVGVLLFMLWLPTYSQWIATLTGDAGGRVALAHIVFNIATSLAALPFATTIARLLYRLIPE